MEKIVSITLSIASKDVISLMEATGCENKKDAAVVAIAEYLNMKCGGRL